MVQSLHALESALFLYREKICFSFDSHSHNSGGCVDPNGQSVLLEFCSFTFLNNFILKYLVEQSNNSYNNNFFIKVEVVNNIHFDESSNHLVKLNDVYLIM